MDHTSASMKAHLTKKKVVTLENGTQTEVQASGIIWGGKVITDPKDLPTDDQIKEAKDVHRANLRKL